MRVATSSLPAAPVHIRHGQFQPKRMTGEVDIGPRWREDPVLGASIPFVARDVYDREVGAATRHVR